MTTEPTEELERYLHAAAERDASDVFLLPGEPVSFRIHGDIQRDGTNPLTPKQIRAIAASVVSEDALADIGRTTGDFTASYEIPGVLNSQVSIAKCCGDYTIAVRVLPTALPTVADIGLPQAITDACDARNGLILIGGRVGSGKTTSCYALLDDINTRRSAHICTVEDPVAIRLTPKKALIQQREVGLDAPNSISAVRAALRQDFDVLFVSETNLPEEAQALVTAAETYATVITQVHARSPQAAIQRLIDVQPEETMPAFREVLADALRVASVQCLLPNANGPGRLAAYGVLLPDDEMRAAIADGRDLLERDAPLPPGCQTLREHIQRLLGDGEVTQEAAEAALRDL